MAACGGVIYKGSLEFESIGDEFYSSILGICSTSGIIGSLIVILLRRFIGLPFFLVVLINVQSIFTAAFEIWAQKQRFILRYKSLVAITLLSNFTATFVAIIFVSFSESNKAVLRIISSNITLILFYTGIFINVWMKGKKLYNAEVWRFVIKYNCPLVIHSLAMVVLAQSDRIMISKYCNNSSVAIYGLVYNLSMAISIIKDSINASFHPWIYKKLENKRYSDIGKPADTILCLIAFLAVFVSSIAPEIIRFLAPMDYYNAIWLVPVISLSVVFMYLYTMFANIESYYLKTVYIMIGTVSAAIVNVLLNHFFIRLFDYQAAAYTTLACYILLSVFHFCCMKKTLKKQRITEEIYHIKIDINIVIFATVASFGMMKLYDNAIVRYAIVLIMAFWAGTNRKKIFSIIKSGS